jgi:hypothetical protein
MAYKPELEAGENLRYEVALQVSEKNRSFHFAVSDRAVYWPEMKLIAVSDPYYFRRVPHNQIQQVTIRRLPPYGFWVLAALMIMAGSITTVVMMTGALSKAPGEHPVSGWPIAVLVGGLILPFAARGRFGLQVTTSDKSFRWKPPMLVDKASRNKVATVFDQIRTACLAVGLRVQDEREKIAAV